MSKVTTRTAEIFIDNNSILHITFKENCSVDYEDVLDNNLVCKNLTEGQPFKKLLDLRYHKKIEKKAKQFIDSRQVQTTTIARAVIVSGNLKKWIAALLLFIKPKVFPVKYFTNYDEAIYWLNKF